MPDANTLSPAGASALDPTHTQTPGSQPAETMRRITFLPAGVSLDCEPGTTVLETALAAGFFPRHSCRRGECHACAARLVRGCVSYPAGFRPEGIAADQCLTCMAEPDGEVVIEAPEVSAAPGRRIVTTGARVVSVERASHDVAKVRLQVPPATGFGFAPGQYMDVILRDGTRRSYSMANAPDETGGIEWHVRAVPGGRFSNHVYQSLKPRDLIRVEGPFGSFGLSSADKPVILLASGTGYAPIAAMLKAHTAALETRGATLYWGGRRREDLYAFEETLTWSHAALTLRFVPVLSDPAPGWAGRRGFVHEAVQADFPDMRAVEVYACGNPLMVDAARTTFTRENGLPAASFFSDAFVTALPHPA